MAIEYCPVVKVKTERQTHTYMHARLYHDENTGTLKVLVENEMVAIFAPGAWLYAERAVEQGVADD